MSIGLITSQPVGSQPACDLVIDPTVCCHCFLPSPVALCSSTQQLQAIFIKLAGYRIHIFEIRMEPDVAGYPPGYSAGAQKCDDCSVAMHTDVHDVA